MSDIETGRDAVILEDVRVSYGSDAPMALDIDALTIEAGERVALIGASGAGKTTLVRLINGLIAPDRGTVRVLGEEMTPRIKRRREFRRRIGCVFQEFNLVERETVFRNVLCGRLGWVGPASSLLGWFSDTDRAIAMQAIEETGLAELRDRRVDTLSGGQRQRVAIARALAQDPDILTADEPVSNLDPVLTADMLDLLASGAARRGATLVMIVHHPSLADERADRILGLKEGRIVYDGGSAPLDARAQRELYGRNLPLAPVGDDADWPDPQRDQDADGNVSPLHVA